MDLGGIGSGSFGSVRLVQHRIADVDLGIYALKRIPVGEGKPWLLKALTEANVLSKLNHPNIVKYHHCWIENINTAVNTDERVGHLMLLLDYCRGGSLQNLKKPVLGRYLTNSEVANLMLQAIAGL